MPAPADRELPTLPTFTPTGGSTTPLDILADAALGNTTSQADIGRKNSHSTPQQRGDPTVLAPVGPALGSNPLPALAQAVQRYFQDGLAPSTRRTYDSAMKRFSTFCEHYQVSDPFPVTEVLLCSFAAYLADDESPTLQRSATCSSPWLCQIQVGNYHSRL